MFQSPFCLILYSRRNFPILFQIETITFHVATIWDIGMGCIQLVTLVYLSGIEEGIEIQAKS